MTKKREDWELGCWLLACTLLGAGLDD